MNLKEINGWTNKSFTKLVQLLKDMLAKENTQPNCNYEAKKILFPIGMEYKKIHACPNDCILYRKDFGLLKNCLRCGLSHYKLKQNDDDTYEEMEKHRPPNEGCVVLMSIYLFTLNSFNNGLLDYNNK